MEALRDPASATDEKLRKPLEKHCAFELKGVMTSVTVMRLRSTDLNLAARQLRAKVVKFPQLFEKSIVVLDLSPLGETAASISLPSMARMLRGCGVVPAGVTGIDDGLLESMDFADMPVVNVGTRRMTTIDADDAPADAPVLAAAPAAPVASPHEGTGTEQTGQSPQFVYVTRPPKVIHQPVRSGQRITAPGTDLIVMGPVNPGAEIAADGHIHVYGPMRGRAFAGVSGYAQARIFCQKLDAEMVCIAGAYVMSDDIPEAHRDRPTQVFVDNGECQFEAL